MKEGDKVQFKSNGCFGIELWQTVDGWKTAYGIITNPYTYGGSNIAVFNVNGKLLHPSPLFFNNREIDVFKEKEIIGWPGNVEEMRQYIGMTCICCDSILFKETSSSGAMVQPTNGDMPYKNAYTGEGFRYCKILPGPAITELTLADIAKKFDIPVDQLRIKE
jgi:hypothetical protein